MTKLLDRSETHSNPKAIAAIRAEGDALVQAGTWDEATVCEKVDIAKRAKDTGEQIHLGELMSISSIKFNELPVDQHRYKGRICFRGILSRTKMG